MHRSKLLNEEYIHIFKQLTQKEIDEFAKTTVIPTIPVNILGNNAEADLHYEVPFYGIHFVERESKVFIVRTKNVKPEGTFLNLCSTY